jgi:methylamine dehydrogenase accessory protein MauD
VDDLVLISHVGLWVLIFALGGLVFALARQLHGLGERIVPAGALMVNQRVWTGQMAPVASATRLDGTRIEFASAAWFAGFIDRSVLLLFVAPDCPITKSLIPAIHGIRRAEPWLEVVLASDGGEKSQHAAFVAEHSLQPFTYLLSEELGRAYGISKIPYAVLIDETGSVAALGMVNSREHLESLFEAKERNIVSIQDYFQNNEEPGTPDDAAR